MAKLGIFGGTKIDKTEEGIKIETGVDNKPDTDTNENGAGRSALTDGGEKPIEEGKPENETGEEASKPETTEGKEPDVPTPAETTDKPDTNTTETAKPEEGKPEAEKEEEKSEEVSILSQKPYKSSVYIHQKELDENNEPIVKRETYEIKANVDSKGKPLNGKNTPDKISIPAYAWKLMAKHEVIKRALRDRIITIVTKDENKTN